MRLPPGRNQRFDFGSRAPHYIGLAEIAWGAARIIETPG